MSNRIPEDVINSIRERAGIVDIIGEFVPLKKSGTSYKGLCPFHAEKTPSFIVNPQKGIYHCFGCGAGGNVFGFIMKFKGLSFPDAVRFLGEKVGIRVSETAERGPAANRSSALYKLLDESVRLYKKNLHEAAGTRALAYLKKRGFSDPMIERFSIGYAPDGWDTQLKYLRNRGFSLSLLEEAGIVIKRKKASGYYDRFRNRIMFPIQDTMGRVTGFGGRDLGGDGNTPKYINTQENVLFHKGRQLYGFFQAEESLRKSDSAIIVEGYIDVIRMHEEGFENTIAPLGTALTAEQISLILRYTRRIYILYDSDEAGMNAAVKSTSIMHERGIDPVILRMPAGKDPGDFFDSYSSRDFNVIMEDGITGVEFVVARETNVKKTFTANEKISIINRLSAYYGRIQDAVIREEFLSRLQNRLDLPSEVIKREIDQFTRPALLSKREKPHHQQKHVETELYLLLLILTDPALFPLAASRLDDSYFHGKWTRMLWKKILDAGKFDNWNASTVMSLMDEEKFIQYLSGRLIEDRLGINTREQLIDYIAALKEIRLKERINELTAGLKKAELENDENTETELMVEKNACIAELKKLGLLRMHKANL